MSYNARGLRVGHSEGDKAQRFIVDKLLETCDVLCIQETFLAKQDLDRLNGLHKDFHGAGESTTDLNSKLIKGRIPGGVAVFWRKNYTMIKVLRLGVDWAIGLEVHYNNSKCIVLNIYTPYECADHVDEYINRLAFLMTFIQDTDCSCVYIVGDMNADISDDRSSFGNHLKHFCSENGLVLSSQVLLPNESYTYVSDAWHTTSWLDHCLCTSDAHAAIVNMRIEYNMATFDHMPLFINMKLENIPKLTPISGPVNGESLDWSRLSWEEVNKYTQSTDQCLKNIELPKDAILCRDVNCTNQDHGAQLCHLYDSVLNAIIMSGKPLCKSRNNLRGKPGWSTYVEETHVEARQAFKAWVGAGRPRCGTLFDYKKRANARFKYALRYIKRNENMLRADSLVLNLQNNSYNDFWKEVRMINKCKTSLPSTINGVSGSEQICQLWKKFYYDLFNCVKTNITTIGNIESDAGVIVTPREVFDSVSKLKNNKSCGLDKVTSEHLKFASTKVYPLLAICFTGFLIHGLLPESLLSIVLVPVLKDKVGQLSDINNYRPIALASSLSKVLEMILLDRLEPYLYTTSNQFGFKYQHSTDMCIFALKEMLVKYHNQNSTIFMCFLDASKAFDRINHCKLFNKLSERGIPGYLIRIFIFWYSCQTMQVKWGDSISDSFRVNNGVRQGGILSPLLFNVYLDDLSLQLNKCNTGCIIGDHLCNHLMYADDLVLVSPYSMGLQQLLNICSQYGLEFDIKYNAVKSYIMIVKTKEDQKLVFPDFYLCGNVLQVTKEFKYLGHYITSDLSDDRDMQRQLCKLYGQANMLARKFSMCSASVKIALFRTFCSPMYTAHLWCSYKKKSLQRLTVAYNDSLRILLKVPRHSSASEMFVNCGVRSCAAAIRHFIYTFICRAVNSPNSIIQALVCPEKSSVRFTSKMWSHWRSCLYV